MTRPEFFLFLRDALHAHDTLYTFAALQPEAECLQGRGTTYRIGTPHGDWVVRRYRRGGAVARVLGERYLRVGRPRPLRELEVSAAARERGVRTPEVMAVVVHPARFFVRGDLATRYIEGALDLAQLGFGESSVPRDQQLAAWQAAGRLVRELAQAGLSHPDLNLKNILIRNAQEGPQAWVLDLDRAVIGAASAPAMWARLQRSLQKWEGITGNQLAADLRGALEAGYRG